MAKLIRSSRWFFRLDKPRLSAMSPENVINPVYVAMLLRRDDQTLLNYINIWIDQIELDGTLAKIRAKWLGDTK